MEDTSKTIEEMIELTKKKLDENQLTLNSLKTQMKYLLKIKETMPKTEPKK